MAFFEDAIFTEGVLPFLLVFVLVFAILQKSKILGDGKAQIDALISLAIALILIGVETPRNYIVGIIPWLAVALVVLLVFMLIYGFVGVVDKDKGLTLPAWVRPTVAVLAVLFVVWVVLWVTGKWDSVWDWIFEDSIWGNLLIFIAIALALWVALGNKSESKGG